MNIRCREYWYGGGYGENTYPFPNNTSIYEIGQVLTSYKVEDDVWTKDYLVITEYSENLVKDIENAIGVKSVVKIGSKALIILTNIFLLKEYPVKSAAEIIMEMPSNVYLRFVKDDIVSIDDLYSKLEVLGVEKYLEEVPKYMKVTMSLSKVLGFSYHGVLVNTAYFKSTYPFEDIKCFTEEVIPYMKLTDYVVDLDAAEEYKDRVLEIFNTAFYEVN
jgi:hypothetical protein